MRKMYVEPVTVTEWSAACSIFTPGGGSPALGVAAVRTLAASSGRARRTHV
jgi:hypothetical protein